MRQALALLIALAASACSPPDYMDRAYEAEARRMYRACQQEPGCDWTYAEILASLKRDR